MHNLDIIATCTEADLSSFILAAERIHRYFRVKSLQVIVPARDVEIFRKRIGGNAEVRNEDEAIPEWTWKKLSAFPHQMFPRATGWYFQQLLKYSYAYENVEDDYYLIWDADTIPLRPIPD